MRTFPLIHHSGEGKRHDRLEWRQDYPNGLYLLLQAIAVSAIASELAEAFARRLSCWDDDAECVDVILAAGIQCFQSPVRNWIMVRPGARMQLQVSSRPPPM